MSSRAPPAPPPLSVHPLPPPSAPPLQGISMLLVFFIAISLPYRVAFLIDCPSTGFAVADFMIDIFFIVDILLNFRTAVVIDGELLTSTFVVARRCALLSSRRARARRARTQTPALSLVWFLAVAAQPE